MKYICQRDYPHWIYVTRTDLEGEEFEKGKATTVSACGCGMCAAVMVSDQLLPNCDFDLTQAIDLSYSVNANHWRGTDYARFAPVFAEKMGLKYETSYEIADVHRCLRSGGTVVALVKKGLFASSGHYINVIGYEPDGRFVILDPSLQPGKYDTPERKGRVESHYAQIAEELFKALPATNFIANKDQHHKDADKEADIVVDKNR